MDGGVDVFGRATTSRRGRLRGTSFGTDGPTERDRSFTGSRFPKTNPCFLPYRPSPRSFLTSHTSAVDARSRCCPGSKPELTKPYARCKARRTIPPQSSRAGRERVGSSTTGPLAHLPRGHGGSGVLRGVPGSRVHGQDSGLRRLQPAVRIHRERAGLLRPAGILRTEAMRRLPGRAQGLAARRWQRRRWLRQRRIRPRSTSDVSRHVQPMRAFHRGSVPAD